MDNINSLPLKTLNNSMCKCVTDSPRASMPHCQFENS